MVLSSLRLVWWLVPLLAACGPGVPAGKCAGKACPSNQACETTTGLCRPVSPAADAGAGEDAGARVDGGTGGGTGGGAGGCVPACAAVLVCDVAARACVQCLTSAQCTDAARPVCEPTAHVCVPEQVASGERCAEAQDITAEVTLGTSVAFTLEAATDDEPAGSCGQDGTPERVFTFTTVTQKDAVIELVPDAGTPWDPVLRVVAADCAGGEDLACMDNGSTLDGEVLSLPRLDAGTYFVIVEALDAAELGAAELRVRLEDPVPAPANDTCTSPGALVLPPPGTSTSLAGTSSGALNNNDPAADAPSCSYGAGQEGPDVVYSFTVAQALGVRFTATPTGGMQAVLYLRKDACEDPDPALEVGCAHGLSAPSGAAELPLPLLQPGTYYLWVDGADAQGGPFALGVETFTPPTLVDGATTDACTSPPQAVVLSASAAGGQAARFLLDTSAAADDAEAMGGLASGLGGLDAVFHLSFTSAVQVTVTATPTTATEDPVLYVREGPGGATVAAACTAATTETAYVDDEAPGGQETLQFQAQPGVDYFLYVDAFDNLSAGVQLVEISHP